MPGIRAGEQVGTAVGGHRSVDETLGDGALADRALADGVRREPAGRREAGQRSDRREPTVRPESRGR